MPRTMTIEEELAAIDRARAGLADLLSRTGTPALYTCYRAADMNLHWARWQIGTVEEVLPELEWPSETGGGLRAVLA